MPNGVSNIGDYTCNGCSGLTNVTIPSGVTSIGGYAFEGCSNLTSIAIPDGVSNIGDYAFNGCSGLTSVTIPSGVTNIGYMAFASCGGLTSVDIPNGVISLGNWAFVSCSGLTGLTIPSSVTSIGIGVGTLDGCSRLRAISVDSNNSSYSSLGGVLFDKTRTALILYPDGATGAYTIPRSVTNIEAASFSLCGGLTSITIPSSVTFVGGQAFYGCASLTNAYFQGNAPAISFDGYMGWGAFDYTSPQFTIYYPMDAFGWSTPTWNGYPAQPYNYVAPVSMSLISGLGTQTPWFNGLSRTNYQLQVSTDLTAWSNSGPVFTATNGSQTNAQPFYVTNANRLFFRLRSSP